MATDLYAADISTSGYLPLGRSVTSAIDFNGDVDWFRVDLAAGELYRISLDGAWDSPGVYLPGWLSNPVLMVRSSAGAFLEGDDDSGYLYNAYLEYRASYSGAHFLTASGLFSNHTGNYALSIQETTPDSVFTWTFQAAAGDSYGGHFIDDSKDYVATQSWTTPHGRTTITSEKEYGYDVSGSMGISEGQTFTSWYFDADSGRVLSTLSKGAYATGSGGPGSEYDQAWTGSAWDDFGANGYHLANGDLPDSFFAWRFVADSGDVYGGHFYDDSRDHALGDSWTTAQGRYEVFQEYEYGFDIGLPYGIAEGATYTTWYADADAGRTLSTLSAGRYATSSTGPGTEYDHAWTGSGWDDFGHGGYHEADGDLPDSFLAWRFVANSGDVYGGHFYDDSRDHALGDSWTTAQGRYEVFQEYEYGFDISGPYGIAEGATCTTWYQDAVLGLVPRTYSGGAYATGTAGPGSEFDYADTAIGWDDFGLGGSLQLGPIA
jgi:hypothetical protein